MNVFEFMAGSPILTFFLFIIISDMIVKIICRFFRFFNLLKNGSPPEHLDADGDFKPKE
jgi:hypothetical protein